MSAATVTEPARPAPPTPLESYRDDGPAARALGAALGRRLPLGPSPLVLLASAAVAVAIAVTGDEASDATAGVVLALAVLVAGAASGRPHTDKLRWTVPPALRAIEYAGILWLGALAGDGLPGAFALLAVVWFRHYDVVYRLRHQGLAPPRRVGDLAGGWEGRLLLGWLLLVTGALPAGFYVLAALLAVGFAIETVQSWRHFSRVQRPITYDDEEDEGQ